MTVCTEKSVVKKIYVCVAGRSDTYYYFYIPTATVNIGKIIKNNRY